jgi:hypothetical protein
LSAEWKFIGTRTPIFPGPVLMHGPVLQMQLSRDSATAAYAAGLVGILGQTPWLLVRHVSR